MFAQLTAASLPHHLARIALVLAVVSIGGCASAGGDLGSVAPPPGSAAESLDVPSPEATPGETAGSSIVPSPATSPGATTTVRAYFVFGTGAPEAGLVPVLRTIPKTVAVGAAAMNQLLGGPTPSERAATPGLASDIPDGTSFLGLSISNGVATVNLSGEFAGGGTAASVATHYAQVVYTLTQFPTVKTVRFRLDGNDAPAVVSGGAVGRAVGRSDYTDQLPAIWVDRPVWGGAPGNPMRVVGLANVFEAQFRLVVLDHARHVLADVPVLASCGTGCWGTFDVTVPYSVSDAQWGTLRVFDPSAKDGTPVNVVEYPVWLTPGG